MGHIYHLEGWQGNPLLTYVRSSATLKNYVRVVEVWWNQYKDYCCASHPVSKVLAYGDVSELKKFQEDHNANGSWEKLLMISPYTTLCHPNMLTEKDQRLGNVCCIS